MLVTVSEVLKWSPALKTINRDIWCNSIEVIEQDLFMDCLGLDFRDLLIADKVDYSGVATYSDANIYEEDDLVENETLIYKSLIDLNECPLTDTDAWEVVKYFTTPIYNTLWNIGMAKWICMSIYSQNLTYTTYHSGGKGIIKHFEDSGQRTVNEKEFYTYKRQVESDIKMAHRVMMRYVDKHSTELGIEENDCEDGSCLDQDSDRVAW